MVIFPVIFIFPAGRNFPLASALSASKVTPLKSYEIEVCFAVNLSNTSAKKFTHSPSTVDMKLYEISKI